MTQVVFIIILYVLINILSLLFNIISFSSDGGIDIGLPFIFIHFASAKYDSTFLYNKLLIEPFLWDVFFYIYDSLFIFVLSKIYKKDS